MDRFDENRKPYEDLFRDIQRIFFELLCNFISVLAARHERNYFFAFNVLSSEN